MGELALILGGGGARAAYQAGVLQALVERHPDFAPKILTGVSAGAINVAFLANGEGSMKERADGLVHLWSHLEVKDVFQVSTFALLKKLIRAGLQLTVLGGRKHAPNMRGLVDTSPLRKFLVEALDSPGGPLAGIGRNIARDQFKAVALTGTRYSTGETLTWCQGRDITNWNRPLRSGERATLTVEHVLASSALPLFFPAQRVGEHWYGDGGIRLHSPLAPALHLGADRLLAISTRYTRSRAEVESSDSRAYPPPAQVAGVLMNAIFLDLLDQDALVLERMNSLLQFVPQEFRQNLRRVRHVIIRPSIDLGRLSADYEVRLPGFFRFLTRRLGTKETKSPDLLSLVMFQGDYLRRLIDAGRRDFDHQADAVAELLAD